MMVADGAAQEQEDNHHDQRGGQKQFEFDVRRPMPEWWWCGR